MSHPRAHRLVSAFHSLKSYLLEAPEFDSEQERAHCTAQELEECRKMMTLQGAVVGSSLGMGLFIENFVVEHAPFHTHMMRTLPLQMILALGTSLAMMYSSWAQRHVLGISIVMTVTISAMGGLVLGGFGGFQGPYFYSIYMMPMFIMWLPCAMPSRLLATLASTLGFALLFTLQQERFAPPRFDVTVSSLIIVVSACIAQGHHSWRISTERFITQWRQQQHHLHALEHNNALADRLRQQTDRARALAHEIFDARETERVSLARDLHDDTGQLLVGAKMELELLEHQLRQGEELEHNRIEHLHGVMHGLEGSIRDMIRRLRTEERDIDLHASLEAFQRTYPRLAELECNLSDEELSCLDGEVTHMIYRLVQEGLTNAAKYSDGDTWRITITRDPDETLHVSLLDNGSPPTPPERIEESWGILGLRERARPLGGDVRLRRLEGWTRLDLTLPARITRDLEERLTA